MDLDEIFGFKNLSIEEVLKSDKFPHGNFYVNSFTLATLIEHKECIGVHVNILNIGSMRLDKKQVVHNLVGTVGAKAAGLINPSALIHEQIDGIKVCCLDNEVIIENPEHKG